MDLVSISFGMGVGLALGLLFGRIYWKKGDDALQERCRVLEEQGRGLQNLLTAERESVLGLNRKIAGLEAVMPQLEASLKESQAERSRVEQLANERLAELADVRARVAAGESERKALEKQFVEQKQTAEELRKVARADFENLAQQVLEMKSRTFSEQTEKSLEGILKPLRERILEFEKKVETTYTTEAKERFALKSEVERLIVLNEKMTAETKSLTQALTGQSKVQGDWGELVLEKILESSGLREGEEYTLQDSRTNDEGARYRPDVVINLPENKHIIVDAKASLTAYDLYCKASSAGDETAAAQALDAHIKSMRKHVEDLADKDYAKLKGIKSPEFVFMFVPVEPAYLVAMQADPDFSMWAWNKKVAIVTATTLLASLKTVASIWRVEKQNRNAIEIATEGARLYDKFVGFVEDFEKIGKLFETGQTTYQAAMGKLKEGPGNVFRKMERLRELGAAPNKQLKAELVD